MLTCIACSKQLAGGAPPLREQSDDADDAAVARGAGECATPSTRQAIKALTAQIKDMALKASGAYRHCKPCAGSSSSSPAAGARRHHPYHAYADSGSDRFHYAYRRAGSGGDATPSVSARTDFLAGDEEEEEEEEEEEGTTADGSEDDEAKEWVAQVEPGVLITFLSLPEGGNDLKRIRFSREIFNKWQAQRWWAENYEKVMELYNVQRFNQQTPLPTTPKSEDESLKEDIPATPPLNSERLPHTLHRSLTGGRTTGYGQPDSLGHQHNLGNGHRQQHHHCYTGHQCYGSVGLASTPKLSSISGAKTETSSMDASMRSSSSPEEVDRSRELSVSVSNASDQEREWVEEDEPGVYITIRALPGGIRELRRVRFSREKFSEMHARLWWEENRARIHDQYL
ncbi:protein Brevis radix-like 1 [Oryza sativa Japonica Group]|uniref:Protein Brevis radix-like 1 n=1 Tax=Oryza sativa subsp. japonica TaxID=39947 RepID=BRXL1_ORYSJ|nr:protein Brevis radix-like 1 [Oryza sativa Japonica Group]Q6YUB8.1 RecName: Full=Protein Brevis radix-like 1; Short=OsBRXL1 [Oryza sativa Japonica Group]KAB8108789.1 hypothetical protein EE612_044742 [Oryza sativa]EAZ43004.1 hypothetical protein OsJ_27591 [Oryza sativa Japonica Group]KAF2920026.1 hypothetical protein DAI22_08g179500 [Oryza sativa Japonica Group]BAD10306.1 major intrinsic protein-like [Oryza sativa Japonica Group]BAD10682.1 major intrinsic protein-like [Oryza sativa Japonica|eukprot:NP_001061986.1 Os08g0462700 [Oryza sativa Japonica Group]